MITLRHLLRAGFAVSCLTFSTAALAGSIGKIVSLEGDGTITRGDSEIEIELMTPVHQLDVVQTDSDGIAVIQFNDKSMLTVGAASQITIDEYVYDAKDPLLGSSSLHIGRGFFQFVSGTMRKDKVKINTPVSTMGIRGTQFFGEVKDDGTTWVSLIECCVEFSSDVGSVDLVREGTYSEAVAKDKQPTRPELSPPYWVANASEALGMPKEKLGMPEMEEAEESENGIPFNRTSFPFID